MQKVRNVDGVIFAVKMNSGTGSAVGILTRAILDHMEKGDAQLSLEDHAHALAQHLIDELDMGFSGVANPVIRKGQEMQIPMIQHLRSQLDSATRKVKEGKGGDKAAGRQTGLAQALAFVRSPYSWLERGSGFQLKAIKKELQESRDRTRS